jgi:putative acetyltransferase
MSGEGLSIRLATLEDADAVAEVGRRSRMHFLPYLPDLHSLEEDKAFFRAVVLATCTVVVAEEGGVIVGFCAFREGWVDHLYLLPGHVGRGLGAVLLRAAMDRYADLRLWVFQQNARAIRFYEGQGFRKVLETDGSGNAEKVPDALYEWTR